METRDSPGNFAAVLSSKSTFYWPLRLIAICSLVAPALLFFYSTWRTHNSVQVQAVERIERSLDVLQEHALKALQTVERAISEINEVLRSLSDDTVRASEADLHLRFKRTQQALPQMESIWAFDGQGRPLVSSTILPVPRMLDNSDRSYFRAQQDSPGGTYVSEPMRARVGSLRFFVVSDRRIGGEPGRFNGVIGVTVSPNHFSEFYRKLSRGNDLFVMVRSDGTLLSRYPEAEIEGARVPPEVAQAVQGKAESGTFTSISTLDHLERRFGYRKVPGFPIYVMAGVETAAIADEFWRSVLAELLVGLPVALAMFGLALYALRRAERFHEELTRREIAEAALKQAQRLEAIGRLTGGVAHDFNNLLMVVTGNIRRIKRDLARGKVPEAPFNAIETAAKRGADLTRQLLSFARRQTHEAISIDVRQQLSSIRDMLQSSLRGNIRVTTEATDDIWRTKIDVSELELALINLAVNARDAMSSGGQLIISASNATPSEVAQAQLVGEFVVIRVRDTGAGIPADVLHRVFEPFFTTKEVGKGTGLGLSQVYGFATQAGGTALVESEVGTGTTVSIYLPKTAEPAQPLSGKSEALVNEKVQEQGCVLLVEDNPDVAEVTRGLLVDLGYSVISAPDVVTAQQVLNDSHPHIDAVLTDIVMPGGRNGLDLARWVQREFGSQIPVILATGYSENAQEASDEGFLLLRKPYEADQLREALAHAQRTQETAA